MKKLVIAMVLVSMLLVAGCQNDTEIVFRNSARALRKGEGAESRNANPYAKTWRWGNQQGIEQQMGPQQY